jgi:hypothetical protein
MRNVTYAAGALAALLAFTGSAAADSRCSNVSIQVKNDYRDPATNAKVDIKVVDFKYWDKEDDKWRNEVTDNKRIDTGQTEVWNKNLEYVGGETGVKVKVYYRYDQAGGGWSATHSALSDAFKCTDGATVPVTVN